MRKKNIRFLESYDVFGLEMLLISGLSSESYVWSPSVDWRLVPLVLSSATGW